MLRSLRRLIYDYNSIVWHQALQRRITTTLRPCPDHYQSGQTWFHNSHPQNATHRDSNPCAIAKHCSIVK